MTNNLLLHNVAIRIGNSIITQEQLNKDLETWGRIKLFPNVGIHYFQVPDWDLFRALAFELMPFSLIASELTVMDVELLRFPYSINGQLHFQGFSCRMYPVSGSLTSLTFHQTLDVIVKNQVYGHDFIAMDVGDTLHTEIYLNAVNPAYFAQLQPPMGYRAEVNFDRNEFP